jgi:hypothetical protein
MLIVALARLMNDVDPGNLRAQSGQRLSRCHCLIDGARALTASKDKQRRRGAGSAKESISEE